MRRGWVRLCAKNPHVQKQAVVAGLSLLTDPCFKLKVVQKIIIITFKIRVNPDFTENVREVTFVCEAETKHIHF